MKQEEKKKQQSVAQTRRITSYPSQAILRLLELYCDQTGESESSVVGMALKEFLSTKAIIKSPK